MNDNSPKCSCCAGEGIPVSGVPCVCGGRGTQEAELQGFRETCFDLRQRLAEYEAQDIEIARKLQAGTLHVVHCNADHSKPVGQGICCCPAGRETKVLRAERDKLLGFYTEIVKGLGDDIVLKRIRDLEVEVLGLRGHSDGVTSTMEIWQTHAQELAKEFPGVDWDYVRDFAPHVRALRAQVAQLKDDNEALDKEDDITGACLRQAADEGDRMRAALDITLAALDDIHISAHCIAKAGPLSTPTLADAWTKFMSLDVKATNAISQARQARKGTS